MYLAGNVRWRGTTNDHVLLQEYGIFAGLHFKYDILISKQQFVLFIWLNRSDCLKILGECVEKEKLGVGNVEDICTQLSPDDQSSCISLESYLSK